eukprot:gene24825-29999_t
MAGTSGDDVGWGVAVDANAALVYVTGQVGAGIHGEPSSAPSSLSTSTLSPSTTSTVIATFFSIVLPPRGTDDVRNGSSSEGNGTRNDASVNASLAVDVLASLSSGAAEVVIVTEEEAILQAAGKLTLPSISLFPSDTSANGSSGSMCGLGQGPALIVGLYFYHWGINARKHELESDAELLFDAPQRAKEKVNVSSPMASSGQKEHGRPPVNNIRTPANPPTGLPKETELRPAIPSGVSSGSEYKSSQSPSPPGSLRTFSRYFRQLAAKPLFAKKMPDTVLHCRIASQEARGTTVVQSLTLPPTIRQYSNHLNSVVTRMAALEVAVQEQRTRMINSKLACDLTALSAKQALLAEFDRAWCLDTSTGLFIVEPKPSIRRSSFRSRPMARSKVSPLLPRVRTVAKAVSHSISSTRSMHVPHDGSIVLDKTELNAPDYLFVSYQLARIFPHLVESSLVLQYRSPLPGNAGLPWQRLVRSNHQPSVVTEQDVLQYDASFGQGLDDVEKSMQATDSSYVARSSPMMPAPSQQGLNYSLNFFYPCFSFVRDGVAHAVDAVHQHLEQDIHEGKNDGNMLVAETGFIEMHTTYNYHGGSIPSSPSKRGADDTLSSQSTVNSLLVRELFSDWASSEEDEKVVGASARCNCDYPHGVDRAVHIVMSRNSSSADLDLRDDAEAAAAQHANEGDEASAAFPQ